jgi:Integral membrane protein DUF92
MAKRFVLAGTLLDLLVGSTTAFTLPTVSPPLALQRSNSHQRFFSSCEQPQALTPCYRYTSSPSQPQLNKRECIPRLRTTAMCGALTNESLSQMARVLFRYEGKVPFLYSLGINVVLFAILRTKLLSALTPAGFFNALGLGTMLWTTLGWRGWSYCVLYLVFGQLVTKIRFADKEKRGLAEGRGGRRGPENVSARSCSSSVFAGSLTRQGLLRCGVLQRRRCSAPCVPSKALSS